MYPLAMIPQHGNCTLVAHGYCEHCYQPPNGCYVRSTMKPQHQNRDGVRCPCAQTPGGGRANAGKRAGMNKADSETEATATEIAVPQDVDMETAGPAGTSKRKANESAQEAASHQKHVAETVVESVQEDEYLIDLAESQDALMQDFYSMDLETQGSKFNQEKFLMYADRLPDLLRDESLQVARKHGFVNDRLWLSFAYFCFALSNKQPKELHVLPRGEVVSSVVAEPHEDIVLTQGYVTTKLDMAWRTCSKDAVLLYRRFFPKQALQIQSLALWLVAVGIFRYTGKMELLNGALLTHTEEQVTDSLRSVQSFTGLLKKSLHRTVQHCTCCLNDLHEILMIVERSA